MNLLNQLGRALRTYRAFGVHSHVYWGRCARCQETTPWSTNAWAGEYRCTRCDHDQLRDDAD
jgi:hypothetical protein